MKAIFFLLLALLICSEGSEIQRVEDKSGDTREVNEEVVTAKMTKEEFRLKYNVTKEQIAVWDAYLEVYRKYYSDFEAGNINRSQILEDKLNHIEKWNREYEQGLHDYKKGVNPFTGRSEEENAALRMKTHLSLDQNFQPKAIYAAESETFSKTYPKSVDWREKGIVSSVKYQSKCAACYAFSVTDSMEAQYNKKSGENLLLSAQMLVDCTKDINLGCDGGYMEDTFDYVIHRGGVVEDRMYRYEAKVGKCRSFVNGSFYSLKDYAILPPGDEIALMRTIADVGPVAVGIDASLPNFLDYDSGIFDDPQCKKYVLDHTGVIVGYGTENGKDYWIFKNSWSEFWGEEGYMRVRRNKGNVCGIASRAMYPIL